MNRLLCPPIFALALFACGGEEEGAPILRTEIGSGVADQTVVDAAIPSACRSVTFEGVALTHCVADPAEHRIVMDLGPGNGGLDDVPYRSLANLAGGRPADAPPIAFAVNGGMFDGGGRPIGYYVEGGNRAKELSLSEGPGKFHMKPNGVFYGSNGRWHVRSSADFYSNVGDRPDFGTQSGPMLVIDGKLHPRIAEDGPSKAIRNAVGVDDAGRAHFVTADTPLSFGVLARYYRDELKTPNALFLDGNISALWNPAGDRLDIGAPIGPIIVVEKRE
ncbi:MAG: phosphodiester glycosidase family protein [Pontixanthobacter sp.]